VSYSNVQVTLARVNPLVRAVLCLLVLSMLPQLAFAAVAKHPAEALIKSGETAMRIDPELSKHDAETALEMLRRQPDPDLEVQAHLLLCDYYSERDRHMAEQQLEQARALLPNVKRQGLHASVANYEGEIYETAGDNARASVFYEQAVSLATDSKDNEMLAKALYSRGYILGLQGQYAAGLKDLQRSQTLFEDLKMPASYALNVLNSIALLYNRLGDYAQAVHIYQQALKMQRAGGMRREEAVTLHNLARANENLQQWDAAKDGYAAAYAICQDLHYSRGAAYALRGMAAVANAQGDPRTALETLDRAEMLQQETPDARLNAQIQLARGIALHQLQRLPDSAAALEQAQQIFAQAESLNELSSTYTELASVYADMGNWRKAYEVRSAALTISTKVFRNQLDQRFATLKVEFDTATKEKENVLLTRENAANQQALAQASKARNLQTAVIILSAVLVVLLGTLAWYQRRGKQRMRTLAMTDELTNVPNRRAVLNRLEPLLQRKDASVCAMLIIDIDHFKSINDQFGHPAGDETLKLVSEQLRNAVTEPAFAGRLGGEEFVLVLPNTRLEEALRTAEQFREAIATLDLTRWLATRLVTVSIGVTISMPKTDTPSSMLRRADSALYAAKHAGRNCVKCEPPWTPAEATVVSVEEASLLIATAKAV
jgi:diguanylate cyclase (GGDEF)-like protein